VWVLSCGPDIVPLVGARRRERLTETLGAMMLTGDDLQQIERAVPVNAVAGDRYVAAQCRRLTVKQSRQNRRSVTAGFGTRLDQDTSLTCPTVACRTVS
jgi:hypothetical protein